MDIHERGICISGELVPLNKERTEYGQKISDLDIRKYLLYWNRIGCPISTNIKKIICDGFDILEKEGIYEKQFWNAIGHPSPQSQVESTKYKSFFINNKDNPGQWSLASSIQDLYVPKGKVERLSTIECSLYDSLPIPSEDVSLSDIIKFKIHRADELNHLRRSFDDLYSKIITSGDIPRQLNSEINSLSKSIKNLNRVANESFTKVLSKSISIQLNPISIIPSGAILAEALALLGVPEGVGFTIGAGLGGIKFDVKQIIVSTFMPEIPKDFLYIDHAFKDGILPKKM